MCGQLLLMDPLLAINKVFSLVSQEERQRKVGSQFNSSGDSTNTMAFAMKNDSNYRPTQGVPNKSTANNSNSAKSNRNSQKGGRPFCTHCNYLGYTFEKCYKCMAIHLVLDKNRNHYKGIHRTQW